MTTTRSPGVAPAWKFRQVGGVSAAGALGLVAIQMLLDGAVPAVGQVAQQVALYLVKVFCRHGGRRSRLQWMILPKGRGSFTWFCFHLWCLLQL